MGLAVLLLVCRPEGLFLGGLACALRLRQDRGRALGIYCLVAAALLSWHVLTFGQLAPNAYYAKASTQRWNEVVDGARYLGRFLASLPGLALGLCFLAGSAAAASRQVHPGPALLASAALAIVIVSGGDGYRGTRLLLPFCLAAIVSAILATRAKHRLLARCSWAGPLLLIAASLPGLPFSIFTSGLGPGDLAARTSHYPGEGRLAQQLASIEPPITFGHLHLQSARWFADCLLYTSPSPRDRTRSRMPSSA